MSSVAAPVLLLLVCICLSIGVGSASPSAVKRYQKKTLMDVQPPPDRSFNRTLVFAAPISYDIQDKFYAVRGVFGVVSNLLYPFTRLRGYL